MREREREREGSKPVVLISFDGSNLRINEGATLHIEICRASLSAIVGSD